MNSKFIVQIDDDEDDCIFFREAAFELGAKNYKSFQNPTQALQDLAEGNVFPSIIILDINMPGMTGYEFLEGLNDLDTFLKVPVFMFSTHASPSGTEIDNRVSKFINKPSCFIELKKVLSQILEEHNIL